MKRIINNPIFKILLLLAVSICLTIKFDYSLNEVIKYDFVLTTNIALFSLALAITAIFFTVLDRYQQVLFDNKKESFVNDIMKEMGDNTSLLLKLTGLTFIASLIQSELDKIPKFDINSFILIFVLSLTFLTIYDITKSTVVLIKNIFLLRNLLK